MGRSRKPARVDAKGAPHPSYATIKLSPTTVQKLRMISEWRGTTIKEFVEPYVKPWVDKLYLEVLGDMQKKAAQEASSSSK